MRIRFCNNRRRGCKGHVVTVTAPYRKMPGGPIEMVEALQCNRCGQAYGLAKEIA